MMVNNLVFRDSDKNPMSEGKDIFRDIVNALDDKFKANYHEKQDDGGSYLNASDLTSTIVAGYFHEPDNSDTKRYLKSIFGLIDFIDASDNDFKQKKKYFDIFKKQLDDFEISFMAYSMFAVFDSELRQKELSLKYNLFNGLINYCSPIFREYILNDLVSVLKN